MKKASDSCLFGSFEYAEKRGLKDGVLTKDVVANGHVSGLFHRLICRVRCRGTCMLTVCISVLAEILCSRIN